MEAVVCHLPIKQLVEVISNDIDEVLLLLGILERL